MGLLSFFNRFQKTEQSKNYYLSITLAPSKLLVSIWSLQDKEINFVGFAQKDFKDSTTIVHEAAIAIDKAASKIEEDVSKVVFGLSDYWLENGKPTENTANLIKKISSDLDLDPQAFIPISAAVNHMLKITDENNEDKLLIGIYHKYCEINLLKEDKVEQTFTLAGEIEKKSVRERIEKIEGELPENLIFYGEESSSEFKKITSDDFSDLFKTTPKIKKLDEKEVAKAIPFAQAADILGFEPTYSKGLQHPEEPLETAEISSEGVDEFGFAQGRDLLEEEPEEVAGVQDKANEKPEEPVSDFNQEPEDHKSNLDSPKDFSRPIENERPRSKSPNKFSNLINSLTTLDWLNSAAKYFKGGGVKKVLFAAAALIIILLVATFVYAKNISKAKVIVAVNGTDVTAEVDTEVFATGSPSNSVQGTLLTSTVSGSQKAVTTGKETVGEYAKGQVTVFNWTTDEVTFQGNTAILSKNGIKFELESEVTVASRSAANPGQGNVSVTASEFGQEGNLTGANDFTFQQFDELLYSARSSDSFAGGDEREVSVVSEADAASLEESLENNLLVQAREDINSKLDGKILHDEAIATVVANKNFDAQIGDEATLLNLNLTLEVSAIVYSEADLKKAIAASSDVDKDEGLTLSEDNINLSNIKATRTKDKLILSGNFDAKLIPNFKKDEIKGSIAGKSTKETKSIISAIPEVTGVEIEISPSLPIINSLPGDINKIELVFEAK